MTLEAGNCPLQGLEIRSWKLEVRKKIKETVQSKRGFSGLGFDVILERSEGSQI